MERTQLFDLMGELKLVPADHEIPHRISRQERVVNKAQDHAGTMGPRGKNFAVETIACRLHEFVNVNELLKQRR